MIFLVIGALAIFALLHFILRPIAQIPSRAPAGRPHCAVVYAFWESDYHPWIRPRIRTLWRRHYATQEEALQAAQWRARYEDHYGFGQLDRDCGIGWEITGPNEVTA